MKRFSRAVSLLLVIIMTLLNPLGALAEDGWSSVESNTVTGADSIARVEFHAGDQLLATQIYEQGQTIAAVPQVGMREGCEFSGWFCNGSPVSVGTPVTGNMTIVAEYTQVTGHKVIVNYSKNGEVFNHVVRSYTPTDAPDTILSPDSIDDGNRGRLYPDQASIQVNPAELTEAETVFTVRYVPADSQYKIRYLGKNVAGTAYDVLSEKTYEGVDGSVITPATDVFDGFEFERFESVVVERGKVNTANVYYTRKVLYVNYDSRGGSYVDRKSGVYGANVTVTGTNPTREGYTFAGWYTNSACTQSAGSSVTLKDNVTVYAKWNPAQANFRVNYYIEDITAGSSPIFLSSETRSGTVGSDTGVTSANLKPSWGSNKSAGFNTPGAGNITNGTIAADGSTIVSVVYPRKTFTINFVKNNQSVGSISARYEEFIGDRWSAINARYSAGSPWSWSYTGNDTTYQDTMPAANTTATWKAYGGTTRTLSYYVEDPNGSVGDPKGQGRKFRLLNSYSINIYDYYSYTFEDEYRSIAGYNRYYSTLTGWNNGSTSYQSVGSATRQDFYYSLNQYPLTMYNGNSVFYSANVSYTYPIASYLSRVPTAPVAGATFAGWYTDAALQYRNTATTMPKGLQLYAKWNLPKRSVTFDMNYEGGGTSVSEVTYNTAVSSITPEREGYIFAGWYTSTGLTGRYDFAKPVTENITVYAKWVLNNLAYTVHYYLTGTATSVYPDKTVANQEFVMGQEVTENAVTVKSEGISFRADAPSRTITLNGDNSRNVIVFYYSKCEETTYTVNYVKADPEGNGYTTLMPSVTRTATVETERVVETAPQANGLMVDEAMKSLTLSSDAAQNIITFVYSEPGKQPVTVRYVDTAGNAIFADDTAQVLTGNDYTATAKEKTGYTADRQQVTIHVKPDRSPDNTITFVYSKRNDLSYTVNCYLAGTNREARNSETIGNRTFEEEITVTAPVISGYTLQSASTVDLTIGTEGNTADFYYYKNVTVTAEEQRKAYGEPEQTLTATADGTLDGDSVNYTLRREPGENIGDYTITVSGDEIQGYYKVSFVSGTYTVTRQTMSVTGTAYSAGYDGQAHGTAAVPSVTEGTTVSYSVNGGAWSSAVPQITNVGTMNVTVKAENPNYETATSGYTLNVLPKDVTVTADNAGKVFGGDDPTLTATVTGTVGNDIIRYTVSRVTGENAGTYAITVSGDATQGNYAVTFTEGVFTVSRSNELTVTAPADYDGVYDGQAHGGAASVNVSDNTVIYYQIDGGERTTTTPTIRDAGNKMVSIIAENPNYETVTGSYTLTVTPRSATVKADGKTRVYDEDEPVLTATVEGVLEGENVTYSLTRAEGNDVGKYAITASGDTEQGNYVVAYEGAEMEIIPSGALAVTVPVSYDGIYDGQPHGDNATVNVPDGTTVYYSVDGGNWTATAPTITNVGSITVDVKAENPNYETVFGSYTLTVAPKSATVKADGKIRAYDEAEPVLTATVEGVLEGETVTYSLTRAEGNDVGRYAITASGDAEQGNYNVTFEGAELEIVPGNTLAVTVPVSYEGTYDGQPHGDNATVNVPDGTTVYYSVDGGDWTETAPTITNVGSITVDVKAENSNYETATGSYTLTVDPKSATVKADGKTGVYDEDEPELTATVEGVLEGETVTYSLTRAEGNDVGKYAITASGDTEQGNYVVAYEGAELEIVPSSALTVTAPVSYDGIYDGQPHGDGATTNVPDGTVISYSVDGGEWTTTVPTITGAGTMTVQVKAENSNYETATGSYTLTVDPKSATVKADGKTRVYDEAEPVLTATVEGVLEGETVTYSLTRAEGNDVGKYTITASGDAEQGNYFVTYEGAELEIVPSGALTVNVPVSYEGTYDGQSHGDNATVNVPDGTVIYYSVDGENWIPTAPTITDAGTVTVQVKVENPNYETVTGSYTLTVDPKSATVKADGKTRAYDEAEPELTATVEGVLEGENVTYSLTRAEGNDVGKYAITASGDAEQGNYIVTFEGAELEIVPGSTLAVTVPVSYEGTYDGQPHGDNATANVPDGTVIYYSVDGENWTPTAPAITDAGTVTVQVKVENPNYETVTGSYTLTVDPKSATVKADGKTRVYDEAEPELTATVEGVLEGETVTYSLTREEGENVGKYAITASGDEAQGNYIVTYEGAELEIVPASGLEIETATDYNGVYDGGAHGGTVTANIPDDTVIRYQADGGEWTTTMPTITDVGKLPVNVKIENPNYEPVTGTLILEVSPREVTLTSESVEKVYDGEALVGENVTEVGFVAGDGATYTFAGTQTLIGESENAFEYELNEGTKAGNYRITVVFGTLTVKEDEAEISSAAIGVTHEPGEYDLGDEVVFTITVINAYDSVQDITIAEQTGVRITGAAEFAGVDPGEQVQTTAVYTITAGDMIAGNFANTATASFSDGRTYSATDTVETKPVNPTPVITVDYYLDGASGEKAAETVELIVTYGDDYRIVSPYLTGYTASAEVVEGTALEDARVDVVYTLNDYTLEVDYVLNTGEPAAEAFIADVTANSNYEVRLPEVAGYTPSVPTVSGTMPAADTTLTVIYIPEQSYAYDLIENDEVPMTSSGAGGNAGDSVN